MFVRNSQYYAAYVAAAPHVVDDDVVVQAVESVVAGAVGEVPPTVVSVDTADGILVGVDPAGRTHSSLAADTYAVAVGDAVADGTDVPVDSDVVAEVVHDVDGN